MKGRIVWVFWLVVVLAVLSSTASYAWVAMNTAAGIRAFEVEAFCDSIYLQISDSPADGYDKKVSFSRQLFNFSPFDEPDSISLVSYGIVPEEGAMIIEATRLTEENASDYGDLIGRYIGGTRRFYSADASDITDGNDNYVDITDNLNYKDSLIGYYVIDEVAVHTNAESEEYYYVKTQRDQKNSDYSCLGNGFSLGERLAGRMYWGYSESDTELTSGENNVINVVSMDVPKKEYSLKRTVYLRGAEKTVDTTNLRISKIEVEGKRNSLTDSLRIMFVASNSRGKVIEFYSHRERANFEEIMLTDELLGNAGDIVTVDMYIYFDGRDEDARNTAEIINSHIVSVTFTVDDHEYNRHGFTGDNLG